MRVDPSLRWALVAGLIARVLPMLVWPRQPCVRDECTYVDLSQAITAGEGIIGTKGWLWAPAYPWLLSVHEQLFGTERAIYGLQVIASLATVALLHHLGTREISPRAGRVAAWVWALSPTVVFYTGRLWSETLYAALLIGAVACLGAARRGSLRAAGGLGVLVGACVLFRGVATYILPIFLLILVWARQWKPAVLAGALAVLTVAPYSIWATHRFGAVVISDRTLGQMMWLGNNDFAPVTFDWGNGILLQTTYDRVTATGRPHCQFDLEPARQDTCEVAHGVEWIKAHPEEFLERVPIRVAQLLNPHTFLTRHLRWGYWKGMPAFVDEILVVVTVALSFFTLIGGTVGVIGRGRSWLGATAVLVVGYHVAAIAVLAGLSRYRFPLEPFWLLFAADLTGLDLKRWRGPLAIVATLAVLAEMLVYLPTGWME